MRPDDTAPDSAVFIPLYARDGSVRAYTAVDAADAAWVDQWRWHVAGGYARRAVRDEGCWQGIYLHRELLGLPRLLDERRADHIDRDRLNNRRSNLRVVTDNENKQNQSSQRGSSSRYRGVSLDRRRGKWRATIDVGTKTVNLGRYDTEEEAAMVARQARLKHFPYAVD